MMASFIRRAEEIARIRRRAKVGAIAEKLRETLGETAVSVEEARVVVRGRGIIRRWLTDPALRFLSGGLT
jgi:hypothetical protein